MARRKRKQQWDYRAAGMRLHKTFVTTAMSKRIKAAAKDRDLPVSRFIEGILEDWFGGNAMSA